MALVVVVVLRRVVVVVDGLTELEVVLLVELDEVVLQMPHSSAALVVVLGRTELAVVLVLVVLLVRELEACHGSQACAEATVAMAAIMAAEYFILLLLLF